MSIDFLITMNPITLWFRHWWTCCCYGTFLWLDFCWLKVLFSFIEGGVGWEWDMAWYRLGHACLILLNRGWCYWVFASFPQTNRLPSVIILKKKIDYLGHVCLFCWIEAGVIDFLLHFFYTNRLPLVIIFPLSFYGEEFITWVSIKAGVISFCCHFFDTSRLPFKKHNWIDNLKCCNVEDLLVLRDYLDLVAS